MPNLATYLESFPALFEKIYFLNLLAIAVPMNPLLPNTVTTSPEKEDLPPRPLFIAAVLISRGLTSEAKLQLGARLTKTGAGFRISPLIDRAAILSEIFSYLIKYDIDMN